jgi:hypothetical protein
MKRLAFALILLLPAFHCFGQGANLDDTKKMLQGLWLSKGDSTLELEIREDSLITFRFRLGGVSRCSYKLSQQACEKLVKFPAATGVYMVEKYKDKELCCAFSQLSATLIKIIYPDGHELTYNNEKMLQRVK